MDVSVKETSVCIVDNVGKIVREVKVASEPEVLLAVLKKPAYRFKRIGLEAGPLSQWLFSALAEAELPVVCVETRHMQVVLKAQLNKTDRNDARGMAQMIRAGLYRPVHVRTLRSQKLRMLLTHRKLLLSKAIAIENDLRGTSRNFSLKVGIAGTGQEQVAPLKGPNTDERDQSSPNQSHPACNTRPVHTDVPGGDIGSSI
jgi:transposase